MKSVEELLLPRYKVIADYPGTQYSVGEILPVIGTEMYIKGRTEFLSSYPHLFQPLPWWSDREVEDMPEYVKVIVPDIAKDTGEFCKVHRWSVIEFPHLTDNPGAEIVGYTPNYLQHERFNFEGQVYGRINAVHLVPATREEYEQYKQHPLP